MIIATDGRSGKGRRDAGDTEKVAAEDDIRKDLVVKEHVEARRVGDLLRVHMILLVAAGHWGERLARARRVPGKVRVHPERRDKVGARQEALRVLVDEIE